MVRDERGNSSSYLLRRLARSAPEVLAQFEAGKFPSVRAAARAAGFGKVQTAVARAVTAWTKLTDAERAEFSERIQLARDPPHQPPIPNQAAEAPIFCLRICANRAVGSTAAITLDRAELAARAREDRERAGS